MMFYHVLSLVHKEGLHFDRFWWDKYIEEDEDTIIRYTPLRSKIIEIEKREATLGETIREHMRRFFA